MATHINNTLTLIDTAIASYSQNVFTGFAGPVTTMIQAGGVVGLALIALNSLFQFVLIRMSSYITWGVRYVIVLSVATTWSQFEPIYNILTNVPGNIGAALLSATSAPNLNLAMDEMVTAVFDFSDRASEESGWLGISLTSVVLIVLSALMACVAILVSALAKVGLAMAVSLAPVFIACLMFNSTRSLFESWTRFTLGFALIPLVLAGVMGAVIGIGQTLATGAESASTISAAAGFIIVIFAAIFMMFNIPSLVTGLAGTIVTAGTGIAEARAAARNATNIATAAPSAAYSAVARDDAGRQAANNVSENGGGRFSQAGAYVTQFVRMSRDRQRFSDPSFFQPGGRAGTSSGDRNAAANSVAAGNQTGSPNGQSAARTQTGLNGGRS